MELKVMDKGKIMEIIKRYLADKFECDISDLDKKDLNIAKKNVNR